jgi:hypothetical protein
MLTLKDKTPSVVQCEQPLEMMKVEQVESEEEEVNGDKIK